MAAEEKQRFTEIEVERINIVDENGTLRLVIHNKRRMPDPVCDGQVIGTRQGEPAAGMIFYNDEGDECGGLIFGSSNADGRQGAGAALLFDRYKQDQVVGIMAEEVNGAQRRGLYVWDRPDTPILQGMRELEAAQALPDGPEKEAALRRLEGSFGARRVFVGRNQDGEAEVVLADSKGRPRIRMYVDAQDLPRLEFLNEQGEVVYRLPPEV